MLIVRSERHPDYVACLTIAFFTHGVTTVIGPTWPVATIPLTLGEFINAIFRKPSC